MAEVRPEDQIEMFAKEKPVGLTAERLREVLAYDRETGVFTWRERQGRGARNDRAGLQAGSPHKDGYVAIQIGRQKYLAHRLAWLYVHGRWPEEETDHRNRSRADNRIDNLREGNKSFNQQNRAPTGADFHRASGKWRARIRVGGKSLLIGYYKSKSAAHDAYIQRKRDLHPGNTQ